MEWILVRKALGFLYSALGSDCTAHLLPHLLIRAVPVLFPKLFALLTWLHTHCSGLQLFVNIFHLTL